MEAGRLSAKSVLVLALIAVLLGGGFLAIARPAFFASWTNLAALIAVEVFLLALWRYEQFFLPVLLIAFLWAGLDLPFARQWDAARWVVLAAGAFLGCILWLRTRRLYLHTFHYFFFALVFAALGSALDSPYPRVALLKVLSLFLLFLYSATGARVAIVGRIKNFLPAFLLASEIAVWISAICYWGIAPGIFGNQNSMGAITGVVLFPALLWSVLTGPTAGLRRRRFVALILCALLLYSSMARAGMLAGVVAAAVLLLSMRRYRLSLLCAVGLVAFFAGASFVAPVKIGEVKSSILYKQGSQHEGVLQSRRTVWDRTVTSIQEHPWLGTGFGTSAEGDTWNRLYVATENKINREHGSSYLEIVEWLGILGVLPFAAVLALLLRQVWQVCLWIRHTRSPLHPAALLAAIVVAGLTHAIFEDWLLAVGYYLTVLFWPLAFALMDLLPERAAVTSATVQPRVNAVGRPLNALVDARG